MDGGPNLWFGVSRRRVSDGHALRGERAPEPSCGDFGVSGKEKKGPDSDVRVQIARKVLQTGAVVPIYALSDEQHAHSRLILSSSVPLAYTAQGTAQRDRHAGESPPAI